MDVDNIANEIRRQIGPMALMSLGASKLRHGKVAPTAVDDFLPSLIFNARILPFDKSFGKRLGRPRIMQVTVGLNARDLYDVRVLYFKTSGKGGAVTSKVVHYEADDVDAANLNRVLLALDYDGDTILNPRYV